MLSLLAYNSIREKHLSESIFVKAALCLREFSKVLEFPELAREGFDFVAFKKKNGNFAFKWEELLLLCRKKRLFFCNTIAHCEINVIWKLNIHNSRYTSLYEFLQDGIFEMDRIYNVNSNGNTSAISPKTRRAQDKCLLKQNAPAGNLVQAQNSASSKIRNN